jgi:TPR repeat protein
MTRWVWWTVAGVGALTVGLVTQLGWLDWLVRDDGPVRNVLEGLSWPAGILALLLALVALVRGARAAPSSAEAPDLVAGAEQAFGGRLPKAGAPSLRSLGVSEAVTSPRPGTTDVPYLTREFDPVLEQALRDGGLVLLHGPASVGKTRSAAEAVRRLYPDRPLLIPVDGLGLRKVVTSDYDLAGTLVWLDDLERFLTPGGLDPALLHFMRHKECTVVATIRDRELARYERAAAAHRGDVGIDRSAVNLVAGIPPNRRIAVGRLLTTSEVSRARQADDPRIAEALRVELGFAEYLAAGPAMLKRWSVGDDPVFFVGQALTSAAVDIRRAGYHGFVPGSVLFALHRQYLPPGWRDRHDLPSPPRGLAWAGEPVLGAGSCLRTGSVGSPPGRGWAAADYLVDRASDGEGPLGGVPVHPAVWDSVTGLATPYELLAVGLAAQDEGRLDIAADAYFTAAGVHDPIAVYDYAHAIAMAGNLDDAEKLFRGLSATGDSNATFRLAGLLNAQGRDREAHVLYELASRRGNLRAQARMALLYGKHGDGSERKEFYRRAADAGNTDAMVVLAHMLAEEADEAEADRLYRRAADEGSADAMVAQARRSDNGDTEELLRRAVQAGSADAMVELALRLLRKGRSEEARELFERAGYPQ